MNLDWMDHARCRDHDPDLFFPSSTGVTAQLQAERAARVCLACPVQPQCREHRSRTGATVGVWAGGYGQTKATPQLQPIKHGTDAGYKQHIRRGTTPCEDCRSAHKYAQREQQIRKPRRRVTA